MGEQTQNLQPGAGDAEQTFVADPEKTLVAPRFDAREVVTAQPVVPLAESPPPRRERRQGTLPVVLILVSALVGGLVSVFAYRLYQQRAQQSSASRQQPAAVEAPPVTPEIHVREAAAATPEVIVEPTPEAEEVAELNAPEEAAVREEAREDRAGRELEPARERAAAEERPATTASRPRARRVEEITTPTEAPRRGRYDGREATDYEVPARRPRAERRAERRAARQAERRAERNIDRVRAIFEGPPPTQ